MWKWLKYSIMFSLLSISTVWAGSMKFFPGTWDMWMYCWNIWNVVVDTNSSSIYAIDSKIFSHDIVFNGSLPTLPFGLYARLWSWGTTLKAMDSYATWFSYMYTNRYANNLAQLLNTWTAVLYSFLFTNTWSQLTWLLDFYFLSWENGDDSNMQSGIVNGMSDILNEVNSGFYNFLPRPCVMDVNPPLFNGYVSGASYIWSTDAWFYFTIYDFTWAHIVNYRFQSGSIDTGNLINYVRVPSGSGIDNQNGVNSGSIRVYLSWIANITNWNLLAPVTLALSSLDCSFSYAGPWYPLTRNRNVRWYTCFVPFSALTFDAGQVVQVVISWADNANFYGQTHTGSIVFTFSYAPAPFIPGGGGWGGGWWVTKDNCLLPWSLLPWANLSWIDYSPSYYDETCEGAVHEAAPLCPVEDSSYDIYSEEMIDAFQEAYGLGITNKCPIENARLNDFIKRKELVKMLVFFSVKVLGVTPDTTKIGCDQYADMQKASDEMKFYTKIWCQLEIMWMQPNGVTPMKNFYPDQYVTRAQFGTTLSRLIFGRRFNGEKPYRYTRHLAALKEFNIIKVITPNLKETRWFVMLVFSRTRASWLVEEFRLSAAAKNGAIALK